jgi:23S rRNA (adenine2030-N6)-methyltransferase
MLAYRHAFHAGNHGDVLKHLVFVAVLRYLTTKATPLAVVDTHAGAGGYALDGRYAVRTGEAAEGIGALWPLADDDTLEPMLRDYLDIVRRFNPQGRLEQYPGSPAIALELLRRGDSLSLIERHTTDERLLRAFVAGQPAGRAKARVRLADGFEAPAHELPSVSRRALVLIDPSYELASDYARTLAALRTCLVRMATATVIVWYPQLQTLASRQLPLRLLASAADAPKGWLHATLNVARAGRDGFGLGGSGVVVLNPPYQLGRQLRTALPRVVELLRRAPEAGFTIDERGAATGAER